MTVRSQIRRGLERVLGVTMLRRVPRGVSLLDDMQKYLPGLQVRTVFDVGANVGQSALAYARDFPTAQIYSFEPVTASYRALEQAVRDVERVTTFQFALGAAPSSATMTAVADLSNNRVLEDAEVGDYAEVEQVEVRRLDDFMDDAGLDTVDFLKIDTEGRDLDVLAGACRHLEAQQIAVLQVEAGVNRDNDRHQHLVDFMQYLDGYGYLLFGMYEQTNNWRRGHAHLRRTNAVFISRSLAEREQTKGEPILLKTISAGSQ